MQDKTKIRITLVLILSSIAVIFYPVILHGLIETAIPKLQPVDVILPAKAPAIPAQKPPAIAEAEEEPALTRQIYLQAGVFSKLRNMLAQKRILKQAGFTQLSTMGASVTERKMRVLIGPLETREQALSLQKEVLKKASIQTMIVKV